MKPIVGVFLVLCFSAALNCRAEEARMNEKALDEVKKEIACGKAVLVDVRNPDEWNAGHVDGAILIPYEQIDKRIAEVARDRNTPILLYCGSGRRSGIGLDSLKKAGYENVTNLGSVEDAASPPLERPTPSAVPCGVS